MKASRTRQHILANAAPLFNKKGYDGTSMADLEQATGLTKGALYAHFNDKETLAREVFLHAAREVRSRIQAWLEPVPTYKGKLLALLHFFSHYVLDPPVPGGCPLLNTAVEADDHRLSMRRAVSNEILQVVQSIEMLLKRGIKAGEFRKNINVRELAYTIFCSLEGAVMFSRVERSAEPMNIIIRHCKNKLDQITCSKEE